MSPQPLYDRIGTGYVATRRTDPRIAELLWARLGAARSLVNVGAGAGGYEPSGLEVTAVEPSAVMRSQRPASAAPCIAGSAEAIPFPDRSFDVAMTVFSDWHWPDPASGFAEMKRVARERVVVLTLDRAVAEAHFWLTRDYLPRGHDLWRPFGEVLAALGPCDVQPVPVPADCVDGFFHAFWARPERYLDPAVTRTMSAVERLDADLVAQGLASLADDLETGAWHARNAALLGQDELDLGYRLLVHDVSAPSGAPPR